MWFIFSIKIGVVCFLFVLVRATFPRYRYDQLMDLGWKVFLPLTLSFLVFLAGTLLVFNGLPQVSEFPSVFYTESI